MGYRVPSQGAEVSRHLTVAQWEGTVDRSELSEAIIAEMETVVRAALDETIPLLLSLDLAVGCGRSSGCSR